MLLKTVAQSMANHAMNVFLLPVELCQDIERMMCKFWWRSNVNKDRSIHWVSWENMSKKKSIGGLGFRCVRDFNLALLGKQAWRLIKHPELLVSKIFKSRYYPDTSFLNANLGGNPSYIWRRILESQSVIKEGLICRIRGGNSVFILNEPWLPDANDPYVHSCSTELQNARVCSLLNYSENQWNRDVILNLFEARDASLIMAIPVNIAENDSWYWKYDKLGDYSVKSAYRHIRELKENNRSEDNSGFWKLTLEFKNSTKNKAFYVESSF